MGTKRKQNHEDSGLDTYILYYYLPISAKAQGLRKRTLTKPKWIFNAKADLLHSLKYGVKKKCITEVMDTSVPLPYYFVQVFLT